MSETIENQLKTQDHSQHELLLMEEIVKLKTQETVVLKALKDGAIITEVSHYDVELVRHLALKAMSIKKNIETYTEILQLLQTFK